MLKGLFVWTLYLASNLLSASAFPADGAGSIAHVLKKRDSSSKDSKKKPSYAPYYTDCPSDNIVESVSSGSIPAAERSYLSTHKSVADPAMKQYFINAGLPGINADDLVGSKGPVVGIAISGGGFRSMLTGAGALSAMDSRHNNHTVLTGLLQAASYVTGVDGGAWLLGSMAVNNFSTVNHLKEKIWRLQRDILFPKSIILYNADFYKDLVTETAEKKAAGFDISLSDYFGRVLSRPFVDPKWGAPNVSFSSIESQEWYADAEFPYPIVMATTKKPDTQLNRLNDTIIEISPSAFGTFDHGVRAFVPTEYIGTTLDNGKSDNGSCVANYDNFGLIMAIASTQFNGLMRNFNDSSTKNGRVLQDYLKGNFTEANQDIEPIPNPFKGLSSAANADGLSDSDSLYLADASESQNLGIWPLIQKGRDVDVIIAVDNSANTEYLWPDGSALVATYERALAEKDKEDSNVKGFPYIPSQESFVNLHYNDRPVFFGCDGRNTTYGNHTVTRNTPPLVVYLPNVPYIYYTNISTERLYYTEDQEKQLLTNGLIGATYNNNTYFGQCVACAVIKRTLERQNMTASPQCQECYARFCWSGVQDNTESDTTYLYDPKLAL
ncbi:phospholipase B Plb1 [Schizosaccharomyces japonicus yFS275]|uniref:Lysophospholipase n=1 Tax=Schizosaccharomyces japonicus (strain yFS275 / FY16936) TaxID=402676 RepID=B6JZP8_SCHJY|nr:phospholipase B Plb1 [Schizosaccharomyces japonicus yFS275]EEB07016.1 phospholipase B Plb1 [Schizosaccharomyces japonicus yFS275]